MNETYVEEAGPKVLLPALLFILTIFTTTTSGALFEGANPFTDPWALLEGIPFSFSLLIILGTHEFGHYIASRRHGVLTTLPIFIPGPPLPPMIGTFGAVIRIKSPITTKSALVDIGASGPLFGFVVALVVTFIGLQMAHIVPKGLSGGFGLGSSLVFELLTYLTFGTIPETHDVLLNSVAFAGWIGLFVTAMNLLPVGQLDGGHIVYAIIGRRHRFFSISIVAALVALGFFTWTGWFVWAALISFIGMWHPPLEDEDDPLDARRRVICGLTIIVFILTFIPTPFYIE